MVEYECIAADVLNTSRLRENVSLVDILNNVHTLYVL